MKKIILITTCVFGLTFSTNGANSFYNDLKSSYTREKMFCRLYCETGLCGCENSKAIYGFKPNNVNKLKYEVECNPKVEVSTFGCNVKLDFGNFKFKKYIN